MKKIITAMVACLALPAVHAEYGCLKSNLWVTSQLSNYFIKQILAYR